MYRGHTLPTNYYGSARLACVADTCSYGGFECAWPQLIVQAQERDRGIEEKTREIDANERELRYRQNRIEKSSHEIFILKRQEFGPRNGQLSSEQTSLQEEAVNTDLAA